MEAFFATLRGLGAGRLAVMAAVLIAVVGFLFVTISRVTAPDMALLYGNLDLSEGGQMVSRLEGMGVPLELRGGGTQIYVPADQVARLRMNMAEGGLPSGGSMGYEIFDRSDVLGSTSFVQDVNLLRALEGELSRTIRSLQPIAAVRVHIVLPKKELFSREKEQPTASVVLKMRGGSKLTNGQVQAIQNLVAFSVPGLLAEQISIVDDKGNLLARGEGKEGAGNKGLPSGLEEARLAYEANISRIVESLLEKSLGVGKVRAEVSVEMDLQRLTEQSETYDPDGQVVRSTQSSSDTESAQNGAMTPTTIQSSLPNLASGSQGGAGTRSDGKKAEETVNYEISKTVKTQVKELGGIKRVSVAVLVDGTYTTGEDNKEASYTPRPVEELQQITKLVKAAVGFKADRGDAIEVVNLRFSAPQTPDFDADEGKIMGVERKDFMDIFQVGVFALVVLVVFLFVIKPILRRSIAVKEASLVAAANGNAALVGVNKEGEVSLGLTPAGEGGAGGEEKVGSLSEQIVGKMKMVTLKQVETLIDEHPEEAVMLLRTWMRNS